MKKFVMTTVLAGALAFAGSAGAQSIEETLAALGFTPAQIAAVTSISAGTTAPTTGGSLLSDHDGVNLRVGVRSARVSELQACMNAAGYPTGVVDGIFGRNTAAGVRSFQASQGLVVDGIVGIATTPKFQAACPTGTTVVVPTTTTTPVVRPTGASSLNGGESSLEDFELEDGNEDNIQEGETEEIAVIEFDVEDGDIEIQRVDLSFEFAGTTAGEDDPWDAFETITLMVDGEEIASEDVDDEDDWLENDSPFKFRFSGLNYIVEENEMAEISVHITAQNGIDGIEVNGNNDWVIFVDEDDVRGLDGEGIDQFIGDDSETVTFSIEEEGQDDELTIRESDNDPEATALQVEDDERSDWYNIFTFELDVDEDSGDLEFDEIRLTVNVNGATGTTVDSVVNDFELRFGGEVFDDFEYFIDDMGTSTTTDDVDTGDTVTATVVFDLDDDDFVIDADNTEEIELWAEFRSANGVLNAAGDELASGNYAEGTTIFAEITSDDADLWDVEGGDDLNASQLQGAAEGERHTLLVDGAVVTFESESARALDSSDAAVNDVFSGTFVVNVEAFDEPVYIAVNSDASVVGAVVDASTDTAAPAVAAGADTLTVTSSATRVTDSLGVTFYRVSSNRDFSITFTENQLAGDYYAELTGLRFTTDTISSTIDSTTATFETIVLDDDVYRTGTVTLLN